MEKNEAVRDTTPALTAEQKLVRLRNAWQTKLYAESNIARLQRYPRLTAPMKTDLRGYQQQLRESNSTLNEFLNPPPSLEQA